MRVKYKRIYRFEQAKNNSNAMTNKAIDINESTIKKFAESHRSDDPEIRKQLDFGYSFDKNVAILYEIRPAWDDPKTILHIDFVKIRYYRSRQEWNLYWMRASGKWELYQPFPKSTHLDKIIAIVKEDDHGCFYG